MGWSKGLQGPKLYILYHQFYSKYDLHNKINLVMLVKYKITFINYSLYKS